MANRNRRIKPKNKTDKKKPLIVRMGLFLLSVILSDYPGHIPGE